MKTKVFKSGNSLAVRLPKGMEMPCGEAHIRKEGNKLIIEPLASNGWPAGFFEAIRIERKSFKRENFPYKEKQL